MARIEWTWPLHLATILLVAGALCADQGCITRTVPVTVATRAGDSVRDLRETDFRAEIGGIPLAIPAVTYDDGPRRAVLLVDTSSSITQQRNEWETTIGVAKQFAESAPDSVNIALLTFAQTIETRVGFLDGREAVRQTLTRLETARWDKLQHPRRTAVVDAALGAVAALTVPQVGDSILLITDGEDTGSQHDESQLTQELLRSGVRLFAFALDSRMSRQRLPEDSYHWLSRVANATGGDLVPFFPRENPRVRLQSILQRMTAFYRVDVTLCEPVERVRPWRISVRQTDQNSTAGKRLRVRYPNAAGPAQRVSSAP